MGSFPLNICYSKCEQIHRKMSIIFIVHMTATCFNSSLLHYYLQITVRDTQYLTKKTKVVHFIKKKTLHPRFLTGCLHLWIPFLIKKYFLTICFHLTKLIFNVTLYPNGISRQNLKPEHCLKRPVFKVFLVRIFLRSFSGPYFLTFGQNAERYSVSIPIQSECKKIRTRKTSNRDAFHALETKQQCTNEDSG